MYKTLWLIILTSSLRAGSEQDRRVLTTMKYSKHYMHPTVVSGEPAISGQIPYMVSIKEPSRLSDKRYLWRNLCGGSIISRLTVLTAAHCFEANGFHYQKHPELLRVIAGSLHNHVGYNPNATNTQWRKIKKLVLHREFFFPNNDIALFRVQKAWFFDDSVSYVIPARRNLDYPRTCMAAGFGTVGYEVRAATSEILLMAPIHIMPRSLCSKIWEMDMNTFICSNSMVTDVARGDSGGPLACRWTQDPVERRNRDLLVGVVSGKNFDYTTLFTRVSAYSDWIARGAACSFSKSPVLFLIILTLVEYVLFYLFFNPLELLKILVLTLLNNRFIFIEIVTLKGDEIR